MSTVHLITLSLKILIMVKKDRRCMTSLKLNDDYKVQSRFGTTWNLENFRHFLHNQKVSQSKASRKRGNITRRKKPHDQIRPCISRSRPEIDLPKYLGKHEFSVVPRSMFSSAGQLNLGSDKSSIMHKIEDLIEKSTTGERKSTHLSKSQSKLSYIWWNRCC